MYPLVKTSVNFLVRFFKFYQNLNILIYYYPAFCNKYSGFQRWNLEGLFGVIDIL